MEITVKAEVNELILVDVDIDDVIQGINEFSIEQRINYIAALLNEIELDDISKFHDSHKKVVVAWLKKQLVKFETKL